MMKKTSLWKLAGSLVLILALILVWPACGKGKVKSAVKNSFDEVTSQLDKGGNFYLYASTEKFIKAVDDFTVTIRKILSAQPSQLEPGDNEGLRIFDFIYNLYKKSGLNEISGIGISSVAIAEDLNHSKIVIHHYKDKGTGFIWKVSPQGPKPLEELKLLPANTVMAGFGDFDIKQFWTFFTGELANSNFKGMREGIAQIGPGLLQQGIDLNKLLATFKGRMGYVVTLDNTVRKTIASGPSPLEIPDPALAFVFSVNDDYLYNLIASKVPPQSKSEHNGVKQITIPFPPMPITVEPVIALTEGYLFFASNKKILENILLTKKNGKGLTTSTEFKKLSVHIPEEGNGFRFIGGQLMDTVSNIMSKVMAEKANNNSTDAEAMNLFFQLFPKKMALYSVTQNNPEGTITFTNHTMGLENLIFMPAVFTTGVVAAIAIPNLMTATTKGRQKSTMGDMRSIGVAIESYITDNYAAPAGATLEEIQAQLVPFHIRTLPIKDAWGNNFLYIHGTGKNKDTYSIASAGKDGIFNGWDQKGEYTVSNQDDFNNDIIFSNGSFVYGPAVN